MWSWDETTSVGLLLSAPLPRPHDPPPDVLAFHTSLSNWERWGDDDQLENAEPDHAGGHRRGHGHRALGPDRVVWARPPTTHPAADNPSPVAHHMIGTATEGWGADYVALAPHGFATTHIDALCHVMHEPAVQRLPGRDGHGQRHPTRPGSR